MRRFYAGDVELEILDVRIIDEETGDPVPYSVPPVVPFPSGRITLADPPGPHKPPLPPHFACCGAVNAAQHECWATRAAAMERVAAEGRRELAARQHRAM